MGAGAGGVWALPQRKVKLISAGIKLISILLLPLLAEGKLKTFQT